MPIRQKELYYRIVVPVALAVLAACVALAYICMPHTSPAAVVEAAAQPAATDALSAFAGEREQLREMEKAQLNEIIHGEQSDAEIIAAAQRQLMTLMEREESELMLEGMLRLRGFTDAIVSVGNDAANVLVRRELLTQQESSVIMDMVCRETGLRSGNVKIIPIQ